MSSMQIRHILAPTDFSPPSLGAVDRAADLAATLGASLTVMHVLAPPNRMMGIVPGADLDESIAAERADAVRHLSSLAADVGRRISSFVEPIVDIASSRVEAIVAWARAERVDLVVMATHGRSAIGRLLLGSVAAGVLRAGPCPVLMVPARDRVSA
jgi:nucleotide-binding universal stress UspA family protein